MHCTRSRVRLALTARLSRALAALARVAFALFAFALLRTRAWVALARRLRLLFSATRLLLLSRAARLGRALAALAWVAFTLLALAFLGTRAGVALARLAGRLCRLRRARA